MELEGRVALITGASRGIGQGIAKSMAEAGANIVVNYQRNKAGAEETASDVEALGAKALVYQANVKNLDEVRAMVDKSGRDLRHGGHPDQQCGPALFEVGHCG